MRNLLRIIIGIAVTTNLSSCLYGQCMDGPCAFERAKLIEKIKPYGAHWIKEGMTRQSRRIDFMQCDGGSDLREGYEVKSGQSNKEFFDGFNAHTYQLLNCMKSKGYTYLDQCDARCLHP